MEGVRRRTRGDAGWHSEYTERLIFIPFGFRYLAEGLTIAVWFL